MKKGEEQTTVKEARLYSLSEAGEMLGLNHRMMLYYVTNGKIRAVKIGCRWKIRGTDLIKLLYG